MQKSTVQLWSLEFIPLIQIIVNSSSLTQTKTSAIRYCFNVYENRETSPLANVFRCLMQVLLHTIMNGASARSLMFR